MENNNPYNDLSVVEKYEFIGKLIIAAQHGYFGECAEVVNLADKQGLYQRIKPVEGTNEQILDLDNPIN